MSSVALKKDEIPEIDDDSQVSNAEEVAVEPEAKSAVIGIFDFHAQAEQAVKALEAGGFPMRRLSIIGKGYRTEEKPTGFYTTGDRVKTWGGAGLFWGSLWGLLFGAAFFWIPGVGPIAAAGPFVHLLVTGVEGAAVVGGVSALGAALASLGLPKKEVIKYEKYIKADRLLVIAHGTPEEVSKACYLNGAGEGSGDRRDRGLIIRPSGAARPRPLVRTWPGCTQKGCRMKVEAAESLLNLSPSESSLLCPRLDSA
jgi:hypothetical protein